MRLNQLKVLTLMPSYVFKNVETGEVSEIEMRISELDQFKADNPNLQTVIGKTSLHSGQGLTGKKPDPAFRDLLKNMKKNTSQGFSKSKINDW